MLCLRSRSCRSFILIFIISGCSELSVRFPNWGGVYIWVFRFGSKRRLQLVLHSLALRDVVTLWVESMFILDRNEGLAVFPGVSSWVSCRFQFSLAEWALVLSDSALYYVVLRLGASRVECSSLPHSLFLDFSFAVSVTRVVCSAFCCSTLG